MEITVRDGRGRIFAQARGEEIAEVALTLA